MEIYKEYKLVDEYAFMKMHRATVELSELAFQLEWALSADDYYLSSKKAYKKAIEVKSCLHLLQQSQLIQGNFDFFIRNNDKIISILRTQIETSKDVTLKYQTTN